MKNNLELLEKICQCWLLYNEASGNMEFKEWFEKTIVPTIPKQYVLFGDDTVREYEEEEVQDVDFDDDYMYEIIEVSLLTNFADILYKSIGYQNYIIINDKDTSYLKKKGII